MLTGAGSSERAENDGDPGACNESKAGFRGNRCLQDADQIRKMRYRTGGCQDSFQYTEKDFGAVPEERNTDPDPAERHD